MILACLAMVAVAAYGVKFLSISSDYRMFFGKGNPELQSFDSLQKTYTKSDNVLFVLSPRDGRVFSRETLAQIEWLTEQAWRIPYNIRVESITNYQHTRARGDDLEVTDLVEHAENFSDQELAEAQQIAINEPLLVNRLINPVASVTGVNVTIQLPRNSLSEVPEVAAFVRELAARLEARDPNIEVRLTGITMMNNAFPEQSQQDMKTLYPLMFILILLVVGLMLRSLGATVVTGSMIFMTILVTMGLAGWIGISITPPTTIAPVVVMTLSVADSVHILVSYLHFMREGMGKAAAMRESLRINLSPVFLTTLTTALGFLSLNFSKAPPFRDLGNMTAMGVVVAWVLVMTFVPAMMVLLPYRGGRQATRGEEAMRRLAEFVIRRRRFLLWGMLAATVLLIAQVPRNEINDVFVEYFDESIPFRADTDYTAENLTGIYLIEYSLPAPGLGQVGDPAFLQHVENFANWYRQQPNVMHVNTVTDIMKRLNKNLHGDDVEWYRLPDSREMAAQYLLLYELSLPFGLDLNNQVNVNKSATRMTVTLRSMSTRELLAMEQSAQQWLAANTPEYFQTSGASAAIMFSHIGQRNIRAMLRGTAILLVVISLILLVALRSVRVGVISIVPNLVPLASAFGLWGLFVGQIGLAHSVVCGLALGIVVDDTVHFLSKYLRAQREKGLDAEEAVRYAFSTVGSALWITSLVLMIGFGILALSKFELNAGMGLLTAITLGLALIADFLLLPPLLMKFGAGSK